MPFEAVVSPSPSLDFDPASLPPRWRDWLTELQGDQACRWWWIVPTSRRRRQLIRQFASESRPAAVLPRIATLEMLRQNLSGYSLNQKLAMGNAGRLIRVARAWRTAMSCDTPTIGQVLQLDGVAQEWRSAGQVPPSGHPHAKFIQEYQRLLDADRCRDQTGQLFDLAGEIDRDGTPLNLLVRRCAGFLFDGYQEFAEAEIQLIAALGRRSLVRLWLVGSSGTPFHENTKIVLERLGIQNPAADEVPATSPLACLGRALFQAEARINSPAPVELLEAASVPNEVESIARMIKAIAREWGGQGRLADIAIVVPADGYVAPLRAALAAGGIGHAAAAESFALADSRPARLLMAAMKLVRHGWPVDALFDFLRQPLVCRGIQQPDELETLRDQAPRNARTLNYERWMQIWNETLERLAAREYRRDADGASNRADRLDRFRALIHSLGECLKPVRDFEAALSAGDKPATLIAAGAALLEQAGAADWLSPRNGRFWETIPPREWEIDQLAFSNLKDVFEELAAIPVNDFPRSADGRVDVESMFRLALAAETFRTSADDDAGVQILRPLAIRGSRFRVVFAVGLIEETFPAGESMPHGSDSLAERRQQQRLWQQQYLFTQMFESATERLILSRPLRDGDVDLIESPFLRVLKQTGVEPHRARVPTHAIDAAQAAGSPLAEARHPVLDAWRQSRQEPPAIRPWAMPLLMLRYPVDRNFSATELEIYGNCPFQHFAVRTLKLSEIEPDGTFLESGVFVHELLKRFFERLRQDLKVPEGAPLPAIPHQEARRRFLELLEAEWQRNAGENDPTLKHDFEKALGDAFLGIAEFFQSEGFTQVAAEWGFNGEQIGVDANGQPVRLNGMIDRIDRDGQGRELICDYKSGALATGSKLAERVKNGRLLQLPLYGAVRGQVAKADVCHGAYIRLSRKVESEPDKTAAFLTHIGTALTTGRRIPVDFTPEQAVEQALKFAGAIRSGRIALTEYDAESSDPACKAHCAARHACRHPRGYS